MLGRFVRHSTTADDPQPKFTIGRQWRARIITAIDWLDWVPRFFYRPSCAAPWPRLGARVRQQLAQSRADSVKTYLVGKGICSDRMEAKGYGLDKPIDANKTAAGRERNRRVEFMITKQ
jgi:hypothetical protein